MPDDRFYLLRGSTYMELLTYLNTIPNSDLVVHVAKDAAVRIHGMPTFIALVERGIPDFVPTFNQVSSA